MTWRALADREIAQVVEAARPLAEMLFLREVEGRRFDTPERRAALERRLRELTKTIADETLRRHYWVDMEARLADFLGAGRPAAPASGRGGGRRGGDVARPICPRVRGSASPASPCPSGRD